MSTEEMNNAAALAEAINNSPAEDTAFLHGVVVGMRQAYRSRRKEEGTDANSDSKNRTDGSDR